MEIIKVSYLSEESRYADKETLIIVILMTVGKKNLGLRFGKRWQVYPLLHALGWSLHLLAASGRQ